MCWPSVNMFMNTHREMNRHRHTALWMMVMAMMAMCHLLRSSWRPSSTNANSSWESCCWNPLKHGAYLPIVHCIHTHTHIHTFTDWAINATGLIITSGTCHGAETRSVNDTSGGRSGTQSCWWMVDQICVDPI